jgi:hypothetical protein
MIAALGCQHGQIAPGPKLAGDLLGTVDAACIDDDELVENPLNRG